MLFDIEESVKGNRVYAKLRNSIRISFPQRAPGEDLKTRTLLPTQLSGECGNKESGWKLDYKEMV